MLVAVYNGIDVNFYIGVNGADVSLVATKTANIPAKPTTEKLVGYLEVQELSVASRGVDVDYYRLSSLGLDR